MSLVRVSQIVLWAGICLVISSPSLAAAKKTQSIVEVDGKKYRVLVKNDTDVYVYQKAPRLDLSPSELDRRRRAVPIATGCNVRDGLTHGADFRGRLDCDQTKPTLPNSESN